MAQRRYTASVYKQGAGGLLGSKDLKQRVVVIEKGIFMFYPSHKAAAAGGKPIKGRQLRLQDYAAMVDRVPPEDGCVITWWRLRSKVETCGFAGLLSVGRGECFACACVAGSVCSIATKVLRKSDNQLVRPLRLTLAPVGA